jgi:hypothetical protein
VLEIQLRDSQVMNELVFAHGWDKGKEDDGKNHKPEKAYEYNGNIPISMFRSDFFHVTIPALVKSPFSSLEPGWRFLEKENMAFSTCTLLYQSHRLFAPPLWRLLFGASEDPKRKRPESPKGNTLEFQRY